MAYVTVKRQVECRLQFERKIPIAIVSVLLKFNYNFDTQITQKIRVPKY